MNDRMELVTCEPATALVPTGATPASLRSPMTAPEARACCNEIRGHLAGARALLVDLYEREGWQALGYASWRACVTAEFEQTQTHLYRQLRAGLLEREISPMGESGAIPERQLRSVASLAAETRFDAWQEIERRAAARSTPRTQALVEEVVAEFHASPLQGTSTRPSIMAAGHSHHFQTDPASVAPLLPFLPAGATIWECAWGTGQLAATLREAGHPVIGSDLEGGRDFLTWEPEEPWDLIVTNPPYPPDQFLARAYSLGRPFAFLLKLTHLEGRERQRLYARYGLEILVLPSRPDFTTPNGTVGGSWFPCAWFCHSLPLPRALTFCVEGAADEEDEED